MARFQWEATTRNGEKKRGAMEADSAAQVEARLRGDGLTIDRVKKEPVAFLLPDIGDAQLLRIEEFNDPSLQRHVYNSVICLMRC